MKKFCPRWIAVLLCVVLLFTLTGAGIDAQNGTEEDAEKAEQLIAEINAARAADGKAALIENEQLDQWAAEKLDPFVEVSLQQIDTKTWNEKLEAVNKKYYLKTAIDGCVVMPIGTAEAEDAGWIKERLGSVGAEYIGMAVKTVGSDTFYECIVAVKTGDTLQESDSSTEKTYYYEPDPQPTSSAELIAAINAERVKAGQNALIESELLDEWCAARLEVFFKYYQSASASYEQYVAELNSVDAKYRTLAADGAKSMELVMGETGKYGSIYYKAIENDAVYIGCATGTMNGVMYSSYRIMR